MREFCDKETQNFLEIVRPELALLLLDVLGSGH